LISYLESQPLTFIWKACEDHILKVAYLRSIIGHSFEDLSH